MFLLRKQRFRRPSGGQSRMKRSTLEAEVILTITYVKKLCEWRRGVGKKRQRMKMFQIDKSGRKMAV